MELFLERQSRILITFKHIFCWERSSLIFFGRGAKHHVCNIYAYIQKISYFHVFLEKDHLSFFVQRNNIMFSGEKMLTFQGRQERSYPSTIFLKRPSFQNIWRKYHISMYFFRQRSSFIFRLKNKMIFSGEKTSSFLIIQERSYSGAIFLEWPSFQDIWKKKTWFFVQCIVCIACKVYVIAKKKHITEKYIKQKWSLYRPLWYTNYDIQPWAELIMHFKLLLKY